MITTERQQQAGVISAVVVGVLYGLLARITFDVRSLDSFLQIVSTSFLVVAPFCVGAVAVLWFARKERITVKRQLFLSSVAITLFLIAMFATLLEGLICLILVAPVFLFASLIGGLVAGFLHNRFRVKRSAMGVLVLLPFLLGPIEANLPPQTSEQTVTTSIQVDAPPEVVFDQLPSVRSIKPDELGFSFFHLIGLPRPLEAVMSGDGVGSVRTSRWEKGVEFQEVIRDWDRPSSLRFDFLIPPGSIPREALDRHVELGGEYFTVLDGGYKLTQTPAGGTELSLSTRFVNKSQLKLYGDLWGRIVLADFHRAILGLMKTRAERANAEGVPASGEAKKEQ